MTGMEGTADNALEEPASEVLEALAIAFSPCDETVWNELTERKSWEGVLESCRRVAASQGETLAGLLSEEELAMLERPLSYAEKTAFEAAHFTGGLPQSAMPVESLYREARRPGGKAQYGGPSAGYMRSLTARMGLRIPAELEAYPDHLAVEADLAALLVRSHADGAASFIASRLDWLVAYRAKLVRLQEAERCFYCALIDIAMCIVEAAMQVDAKDQNDLSFERKQHV